MERDATARHLNLSQSGYSYWISLSISRFLSQAIAFNQPGIFFRRVLLYLSTTVSSTTSIESLSRKVSKQSIDSESKFKTIIQINRFGKQIQFKTVLRVDDPHVAITVTIRGQTTPAMRHALAAKWTQEQEDKAKKKGLRSDCDVVARQAMGSLKAPTKSIEAVKV